LFIPNLSSLVFDETHSSFHALFLVPSPFTPSILLPNTLIYPLLLLLLLLLLHGWTLGLVGMGSMLRFLTKHKNKKMLNIASF
jgi:hypothetical protein